MPGKAAFILLMTLSCPLGAMAQQAPTTAEVIRTISEPYEKLPRLLKISWREGPEYPMGVQDSALGLVDGLLISAGGFTRHPKDVVAKHADAFDGEPHGFTKLTFLFDPRKSADGWTRIADVPGPARQAAATAVVGADLYVIGGFSYTEPRSYTSTYRRRSEGGRWRWEKLDCELPWPVCETGVAVIGKKIYLMGGADFCASAAAPDGAFRSESGRSGQPVGRALLVLDTQRTRPEWQRLADIPGAPRCFTSCAAAGGKIYGLGGLHWANNAFHNVIDSWVYDPQRAGWSRLPNVPHGGNRRAVTFKDRYVLMLGGHRYGTTWNPDGTVSNAFTPQEKALAEMKDHIEPTVLVFDAESNQIGTADPLLDKTSWPMVAIDDDTIYVLGGEGGNRLWHPATFQIGRIEEVRANE